MARTTVVMAIGAALLLCAPGAALAQARPAPVQAQANPAGRATIEVMVVYASQGNTVDPRLEGVMQNLKSTQFTGFELLSTESAKLVPGGETTVNVVGGRRLKITLVSKDANAAKLRVRMLNADGDKTLDTTVNIPRGKYFMIAGPKYKEGKLVIPVGVDF